MRDINFPIILHKKTYLLLLSLLLITNSFAQISEGFFQYSIKVTAIDTSAETQQKVGMMYNSTMKLFFTDTKSRIDFTIGTIFATSIIVDKKNKIGLSLSSNPNGKYATPLGAKDIEAKPPKKDTSMQVVLFEDERVILGFKCKKATIQQSGNITTYWYTDEIEIDHIGQSFMNENIPGFPLYFSTIAEGMKMEYQASNYRFELENEEVIFSLDTPPGYKLLTSAY